MPVEVVRRARHLEHDLAISVSTWARTLKTAFSRHNSLISRLVTDQARLRDQWASGTTLDDFSAEMGVQPTLMKMDIEGSEVAALSGARSLLSREDRPSIFFEYDPVALGEIGVKLKCFLELLSGYEPYHVDDLQDPSLPFGSRIFDLSLVNCMCNLFAIPTGKENAGNGHSSVTFAPNEFRIDGRRA